MQSLQQHISQVIFIYIQTKLIVIFDKPGQLCNRLWAFSPFVAFCIKHNRRLIILNFDDYHRYFEDLTRYSNIKIGVFKSRRINKGLLKTVKFFEQYRLHKWSTKIDIYPGRYAHDNEFGEVLSKEGILLVTKSWMQFPYDGILTEYRHEIRQTVADVHNVFEKENSLNQIIVGVHLRRGDYKTYRNGRYYFSDSVYLRAMTQLQIKIKQEYGKDAFFFLCSDSPINTEYFKRVRTFRMTKPTAIKDLYALSNCDLIIGPPSTFSMWASYTGNVPLRFLHSGIDTIQLADFSTITSQNRFENGTTFSHITKRKP